MNHKTLVIEIKSTLDKLIAARTSLGYDYIVYGLLLINEDQTRVSNITKACTSILLPIMRQAGLV